MGPEFKPQYHKIKMYSEYTLLLDYLLLYYSTSEHYSSFGNPFASGHWPHCGIKGIK
jgi:hypothetical protein